MTRSTAQTKELISQAIDLREAIPDWVRDELAANPELKEFQCKSIQLADRLQSDAQPWIVHCHAAGYCETSVSSLRSQSRPKPSHWGVAAPWVATAAVSLFAILGFWMLGQDQLNKLSLKHSGATALESNSELPLDQLAGMGAVAEPRQLTDEHRPTPFVIALESTVDTVRSFNTKMTEKVVGQTLDRTLQLGATLESSDGAAVQSESGNRLDAKQIELIREFKRTAELLVQTFP